MLGGGKSVLAEKEGSILKREEVREGARGSPSTATCGVFEFIKHTARSVRQA